jgi:hypothetical protein
MRIRSMSTRRLPMQKVQARRASRRSDHRLLHRSRARQPRLPVNSPGDAANPFAQMGACVPVDAIGVCLHESRPLSTRCQDNVPALVSIDGYGLQVRGTQEPHWYTRAPHVAIIDSRERTPTPRIEVAGMIATSEITDSFTIGAFTRAWLKGLLALPGFSCSGVLRSGGLGESRPQGPGVTVSRHRAPLILHTRNYGPTASAGRTRGADSRHTWSLVPCSSGTGRRAAQDVAHSLH